MSFNDVAKQRQNQTTRSSLGSGSHSNMNRSTPSTNISSATDPTTQLSEALQSLQVSKIFHFLRQKER